MGLMYGIVNGLRVEGGLNDTVRSEANFAEVRGKNGMRAQ